MSINPTITPKSLLGRTALSSVEYLAENAFVAPGLHRLLTASGLAIGLWGGRALMDVATARRASDGTEIPRDQVAEMLRPLHGILRYNPYSDNPADRWKMVVDKMTPMVLGGLGAYLGSRHFAYGHGLNGKPLHPATSALVKRYEGQVAKGRVTIDTADSMMLLEQGEFTRRVGAAGFPFGSTIGTHLPGGLFPFTNGGMSSNSFQLTNRLRNNPPSFLLKWLKPFLGNRAWGSRALEGSLADALRWGEANLLEIGHHTNWPNFEEAMSHHLQNITQNFPKVTAEQTAALKENLTKLYEGAHGLLPEGFVPGKAFDPASKELSNTLRGYMTGANPAGHGLAGEALEKMFIDSGFKLAEFQPGYGALGLFSKQVGSRKSEAKIAGQMATHLLDHHGIDWKAQHIATPAWKRTAIYGAGALTAGGILAAGGAAAAKTNQRVDRMTEREINAADGVSPVNEQTRARSSRIDKERREKDSAGNIIDWVNSAPLDIAQWLSRVVITPPSMHRLMNAAYLSAALWGGMEVANLLTGRKLTALRGGPLADSLVNPEKVLPIFKPMLGKLKYTPGSTLVQDRLRQAFHYIAPVAVGMFGTYTGSYLFFKDRITKLEHPHSLEDYADKVSLEQSKFYAGATAITSIFNTGSGLHLLPVFNYSSNLHNRYLLASGQQVAMPGLGKWWSGNPGLNPWGVKRSLQYITNYLSFNTDARPRELSSLVHSVVAKLYPQLDEDVLLAKKQAIMSRIFEVRDTYLVEEAVPASKQAALNAAMKKLVSGEGFEQLLLDVGLNPAEANLHSNGASGAIANFFGHKKQVNEIEQQYRQKFAERIASKHSAPADFLRSLADRTPTIEAVANDNSQPGRSFAERIKSEPPRIPVVGG